MRLKEYDFDLDDADPNGIVTAGAIGGAGAITLNGALVTSGVATMDFARRIGILSAGDDSGDTFTIVGTNPDGAALTEVVTGGNATTVESDGYFLTVTSITASGASAGNVTIGTVDEIASKTIPVNAYCTEPATIALKVTGTINCTIQEMFRNVWRGSAIVNTDWQNIPTLSGKISNTNSQSSNQATAIRFVVNSHSSGAEVQMNVNMARST